MPANVAAISYALPVVWPDTAEGAQWSRSALAWLATSTLLPGNAE